MVFVGTHRHALSSQSSCPAGVLIDVNVERLQVGGSIGRVAWYPNTVDPASCRRTTGSRIVVSVVAARSTKFSNSPAKRKVEVSMKRLRCP